MPRDRHSTTAVRHRINAVLAPGLLGLIALSPACAADASAGMDCAPIGTLPNYVAKGPPEHSPYDFHKFLKDGDWVSVAGAYCKQEYDLKDGAEAMSALEMNDNYKAQFAQLGITITRNDNDAELYGVLRKDGKETWVDVNPDDSLNDITVTVVTRQPAPQVLLPPSGNDYRLLGHMPGYVVETHEQKHFDQHEFTVKDSDTDNNDSHPVKVQGTYYSILYSLKDGGKEPSAALSQANYLNALKALGAEILFVQDDGHSSLDARYEDHGQQIWMEVVVGNGDIAVTAVEEHPFQATIKPAEASALKTALDKDGHVALYINFDFNKATLRPDAKPVIAQVLALLQANPDLKLSIVGNTDNVGGHDYNVKLSQQRAASVMAELVKDGIAANRLTSSGNGPDQPIADNDSSDGRAKNRRVELVKL